MDSEPETPDTAVTTNSSELQILKVEKHWHFFAAGVMWLGVGSMLLARAVGWLMGISSLTVLEYTLIGLIFAFLQYFIFFKHIVGKNMNRIHTFTERTSIFHFQPLRSYFIAIFMIAFGISLRLSPIPKPYLAIVYIGIGVSLAMASIPYFGTLIRMKIHRNTESES